MHLDDMYADISVSKFRWYELFEYFNESDCTKAKDPPFE